MRVNDVHAKWGHVKAKEHDKARHLFLSVAPPHNITQGENIIDRQSIII